MRLMGEAWNGEIGFEIGEGACIGFALTVGERVSVEVWSVLEEEVVDEDSAVDGEDCVVNNSVSGTHREREREGPMVAQ